MKWNHLPLPGGLNAQDPELLEGFEIIFRERGIYEAEKQKKQEKEANAKSGRRLGRRRSGR